MVNPIARDDEIKSVVGERQMKCVYPLDVQIFVPCEVGEQQFSAPPDEMHA